MAHFSIKRLSVRCKREVNRCLLANTRCKYTNMRFLALQLPFFTAISNISARISISAACDCIKGIFLIDFCLICLSRIGQNHGEELASGALLVDQFKSFGIAMKGSRL